MRMNAGYGLKQGAESNNPIRLSGFSGIMDSRRPPDGGTPRGAKKGKAHALCVKGVIARFVPEITLRADLWRTIGLRSTTPGC